MMTAWNSADGHDQEEEDVLKWTEDHILGRHDDFSAKPPRSSRSTFHRNRNRNRKAWAAAVAAVVVLIILVCAIAIPLGVKEKSEEKDSDGSSPATTTGGNGSSPSMFLTTACAATLYPTVCYDSLSNITNSSTNSQELVKYSLNAAIDSIIGEATLAQVLFVNISNGDGSAELKAALHDCIMFLQDSLDSLSQTADGLKSLSVLNLDDDLADLQTWMSAAVTSQETCLDGFQELESTPEAGSPVAEFVKEGNYSAMLLSNTLAFVATLQGVVESLPSIPGHRRRSLLRWDEAIATSLQRRLLQKSSSPSNFTNMYNNSTNDTVLANTVVALDGSGNYRRIQDAVHRAPDRSASNNTQYVIYIKAGKYFETVVVPKVSPNFVFVGDGMGKTIISGNLSVIGSNLTTTSTATLTILGKNFVGRDFTVENTAGPANHQAVALRVAGDYSAFQRLEILGYQDTLYAHTNRQFYKDCRIVGTVDFIFGNAAVVFQTCQILATTGMVGQENTYTASGRTDPNQNTGMSFQHCSFDGTVSLKNATNATLFQTYLGRPWKPYARTIVMQSNESALLNPAGWLAWNGQPENSSKIYYAEYMNTGPGSGIAKRVPWSQQITNATDAKKFTVDSFVQGASWLPRSNCTYQKSL